MKRHGNLADPAYEPSDAELAELARSAFAHVAAEREASSRALRARIARLRLEARARFESR